MRFRDAAPTRRRANLTPMVDVVFLLLFFFMLASRFGADAAMELALAGEGGGWTGPPRLVEVAPDGVRLNGVAMRADALAAALDRLMETRADPVVIAPREGATTGELVAAMAALEAAGFSGLALVR